MRASLLLLSTALAAAAPLRVMPLGDSLTHGYGSPGGYRVGFAAAAHRAGWSFAFVGSEENGPPDAATRHHEGHPGWTIRQLAEHADAWLAQSRPDLILLLIGTNDILMDDDLATAPERLGRLLERLSRDTRVIVSSLPPLGDPRLQPRVEAFNRALPPLVQALAQKGRRVTFVDLGALIRPTDLVDGIHLGDEANRRLGEAWFRAARQL